MPESATIIAVAGGADNRRSSVAIGIGSGRKSALEAIVAYARMHRIVLHDASGEIIGWEALLSVLIALLLSSNSIGSIATERASTRS